MQAVNPAFQSGDPHVWAYVQLNYRRRRRTSRAARYQPSKTFREVAKNRCGRTRHLIVVNGNH
jgi:hypothetical protein